jgi:Rrf2 family nitric oxide-sensitive transcriptional repressor
LRKVVHQLSGLNYINTFIGKGGGMELKKSPDNVNIGKVFIEFEGINPLIDCHQAQCPLRASCSLNRILAKAQQAFIQEIKQHTLSDLLENASMVKILVNVC